MSQANDQMIAFNKTVLEAASRFAAIALEGAEEMMKVQMEATKSVFADGAQNAKALAEAKDLQDLGQLKNALVQPNMEKAASYLKSVYNVATATQQEISKLLEEQASAFNKRIEETVEQGAKAAPPGTEAAMAAYKSAFSAVNSVYDNMLKMTKQFSELTQANMETMSAQAARVAKKSRT